ncbi:hypothetical protein ACSTJF_00145, partial [Vibrio parahaemolyticus]
EAGGSRAAGEPSGSEHPMLSMKHREKIDRSVGQTTRLVDQWQRERLHAQVLRDAAQDKLTLQPARRKWSAPDL